MWIYNVEYDRRPGDEGKIRGTTGDDESRGERCVSPKVSLKAGGYLHTIVADGSVFWEMLMKMMMMMARGGGGSPAGGGEKFKLTDASRRLNPV